MWNEPRRDILKEDTYRAQKVIKVFEAIGFTVAGTSTHVAFMQFRDGDEVVEPFMVQNMDVAILHQDIRAILETIKLPIPFFDHLYNNI